MAAGERPENSGKMDRGDVLGRAEANLPLKITLSERRYDLVVQP